MHDVILAYTSDIRTKMYAFIAPLLLLIIIASTFQTKDTNFKIWTGYQLNNTVPISEVQLSKNMIQCASKCLNRQRCMAATFNDASMECDLHGADQDIIIVTENIEDYYYLIIPEGKTIFSIAKVISRYYRNSFYISFFPTHIAVVLISSRVIATFE